MHFVTAVTSAINSAKLELLAGVERARKRKTQMRLPARMSTVVVSTVSDAKIVPATTVETLLARTKSLKKRE